MAEVVLRATSRCIRARPAIRAHKRAGDDDAAVPEGPITDQMDVRVMAADFGYN